MRYAIISDIHGNMPALEAVLNHAKSKNIDSFIFLGDYYLGLPYPDEVVSTVRNIKSSYCIKGNEEASTNWLSAQTNKRTDGQFTAGYCAYDSLSKESLNFLRELPNQVIINDADTSIIASHSARVYFNNPVFSSFNSINFIDIGDKHIYETELKKKLESDKTFQNTLSGEDNDIYLFGHSHIQYHVEVNDKLIINPGSCGLPLDFNQKAAYTILDISDGKWDVEEYRVEYDLASTIEYIKNSEQYTKARVWSDIIIEELLISHEKVSLFLKFVANYADEINDTIRPYTHETWGKAYELWSNDIS